MLKFAWKENSILLAFSLILVDVLTATTLILVGVGFLIGILKYKTNRITRNIAALAVFCSYWLTYGKIIDPEVGLNFLVSILVLKILEKETVRDRYMIFFGLLLLISSGSLFERTLTYVFFFSLSFLILISDFYLNLGQKWRLKDLVLGLIWIFPLTIILFFFTPRLLNPIPFQSIPHEGEIAYGPDVNISSIDSLSANPSPVFQVSLSGQHYFESLYWRGNTLSYNDGWNWPQMVQDKEEPTQLLGAKPSFNEVSQTFRLFNRSEYFFTLDTPRIVHYEKDFFGLGSTGTFSQKSMKWVQRYKVISSNDKIIQKQRAALYLQSALTKLDRDIIQKSFPGKKLNEVTDSIKKHFIKEGFSYSLSPGKSASFQEFMQKKVGFCSHYASAVAIILRAKGIPSRLVSGFLGGTFNKFADFYLVSQNDAHVWVEALEDDKWHRLDPTDWIAPERIQLGGQAYMAGIRDGKFQHSSSSFRIPGFLINLKLWMNQWDFYFYQWLEQIDYHAQDDWFSQLRFKREWLFSFIPSIMIIFILAYYIYLARFKKSEKLTDVQELWSIFSQRMKRRGFVISFISINESQTTITNYNQAEVSLIWEELIAVSFRGKKISRDFKKKIKKI